MDNAQHHQAQTACALMGFKGNNPSAKNDRNCLKNKQISACSVLLFRMFRPSGTREPAWILTCSAVPQFRMKTQASRKLCVASSSPHARNCTPWHETFHNLYATRDSIRLNIKGVFNGIINLFSIPYHPPRDGSYIEVLRAGTFGPPCALVNGISKR